MGSSAWESQRGWVFARQSLCSHGQLARDWARGQLCLAVIRHFPLSLAFPHGPPPPPRLVPTHSHVAIQYPLVCTRVHVRVCAHTDPRRHTLSVNPLLLSLLSSSVLFLLSSFASSVPGCCYASQQPLHSQPCPEADSRNHTAPPLFRPKAPR